MLQWHYRSRDGRLIAFSNEHIYQGALTAFPGTVLKGPVTHHLVPFRSHTERSTRSNPDEVEKVVDMVVDHARRRPGESLGVITFGIHHADNIDNALRLRLRDLGEHALDDFFSEETRERFFTKNIERVQGDERDVIILSVGYHKSANGSLPYRFGPLNQQGGERRLNVAVTRARNEVQPGFIVFSPRYGPREVHRPWGGPSSSVSGVRRFKRVRTGDYHRRRTAQRFRVGCDEPVDGRKASR